MEADPTFDEARVQEAFRDGLRTAREYLARFVASGGDEHTATSIRANWNPAWGADDGQMTGELWIDPWGMTSELQARCRANTERLMDEHTLPIPAPALANQPATSQEGEARVLTAALEQNDAMRQELARVGNLVSDLARAMNVEQANADGTWPDLAGRIQRLALAATPTPPTLSEDLREAVGEAIIWHESEDKALSKQPSSADGRWRRMQHQEQIAMLRGSLATKLITSQQGAQALFEHEMRCRGVTASWSDVDEDDRKEWQASADAVLSAAPTPPTLSGNLRALVEQEAVDIIADLNGPAAAQSGTNCRVVEDHLKQFARNLARAQGQAS
ncbi:MAG: hypothetical protein ABWY12_12180 [Burkholderiales bacterium]